MFDRVRSDYVEPPDEEKLIEAAINGMLTSLDPHSSYMNAKRFQEMQVQTRASSAASASRSPWKTASSRSWRRSTTRRPPRAGIMANDLITKLDGEQVQGLTLNEAVDKMRGKVNTPITLTVMREGQGAVRRQARCATSSA